MTVQEADSIEIRGARVSEREQLRAITLAAYEEYSRLLRPEYWESYQQHINDTHDDLGVGEQLVAERRGSILGTALYYPPGTSFGDDVETANMSPDCPEIRLLAVAPEGRGAGVGRALMNAVVARARLADSPGLVLHTMEIMEAARALYASMGFERAPELDFRPAKEWFVEGYRLPI